jgi:hypothetical protein
MKFVKPYKNYEIYSSGCCGGEVFVVAFNGKIKFREIVSVEGAEQIIDIQTKGNENGK